MHIACYSGNLQIVKLLITYEELDLTIKNKRNKTPYEVIGELDDEESQSKINQIEDLIDKESKFVERKKFLHR